MRGRVVQVNVKPQVEGERGLPKRPVPEALVAPEGVAGDHNSYRFRKKANDPAMAVLLYPVESLRALQAEGWPVAPGHLGENVTTEGIPYEAFAVGTRWRVGRALVEVTKPCEPCTNLYGLPYVGDEKGPAFLRTLLGRRGWYARVVEAGLVRPGDRLERAPEAPEP